MTLALPARRPLAVVFDMDGLLLDTERISRDSMIEVSRAMGYPMTEAIFARLIGRPVDDNRSLLQAEFGADFDYDLMRERQREINNQQYGLSRPLRPGARRMVETVARLGIPCAVATSSLREKTMSHLAHTDLLPFMAAVMTRDDVERGKPAPDLYLAAAAALNRAPGDCLALEDSHAGIEAAHAATMPVIMVPDLMPATDHVRALALAVVPDLDTVATWLAQAD